MRLRNTEEVNTPVLKLVKTDRELVEELRAYTDAMVAKAAECFARGMVVSISFDNGTQTGKVQLNLFKVDKQLEDWRSEELKAAMAAQPRR